MKRSLLGLIIALGLNNNITAQDLSTCKNICEKEVVVEYGPFIGIRFNVLPNMNKIHIYEVLPNTAAQRHGFNIGDMILSIDGRTPLNNQEMLSLVAAHKPGDVVPVTYSRRGFVYNIDLKIGAQGSRIEKVKECCDAPVAEATPIDFQISPNPASSKVLITANKKLEGEANVKLYDLTGKLVMQTNKVMKGDAVITLNVSDVLEGEYLVKINTKDNAFTTRLLVVRN